MGTEVERKFLVASQTVIAGAKGTLYRQGYLSTDKERTVRVRIAGDKATLNIKGVTKGITRPEYEYEIPAKDAHELLDKLCHHPLIEKTRHVITDNNKTWEIDVFHGDNEGLVIAEVELSDENEVIKLPEWIGDEVSDDPRYYNSSLISNPYRQWGK